MFTSPLQRARTDMRFGWIRGRRRSRRDLVEWNYGDYEGLRTAEIHAKRPDWQLFRDGCPGGESPAQVVARADNVVQPCARRLRETCCFSRADTSFECWPRAGSDIEPSAWQVLPPEHSEPERGGIRTRPFPPRDPAVERHASRRHTERVQVENTEHLISQR